MARSKDQKDTENENGDRKLDGKQTKKYSVVRDLFSKIAISVYGASKEDDLEELDNRFNTIIKTQMDLLTNNGDGSLNSFIGRLYSDDKDNNRRILDDNSILDSLNLNSSGTNPQEILTQQYRNRMTKQALAQELSEILTELRFAKKVMCNAINNPDTVTGTISRKISFASTTLNNAEKDYLPVVEAMEKKFDLKAKIKQFITPNLLGYGMYYVYATPYYHLFNDFARRFKSKTNGRYSMGVRCFESADGDPSVPDIVIQPLYEAVEEETPSKYEYSMPKKDTFVFVEEYDYIVESLGITHDDDKKVIKEDLTELFTNRITVSVSEIPIPILEDGIDAYKSFGDSYISEDGNYYTEAPKDGEVLDSEGDIFLRKRGAGIDDGIYEPPKDNNTFTEKDVKDCYVKLIPPTRMIPVEMMGRKLFYIYVQTSPNTSLNTLLSYTTQIRAKDPSNKMDMLLDSIAERVVQKFDKDFVKSNLNFKKEIVAALQHYDVASTNIHFQVIPKDYVVEYAINKDVDGIGHSMLEGSIFYGNAYLSMLMFKLMSIFQNSNDRVVNYVRRSGIDKNLWNDVQDIIRKKNARRITMNDIFSYNNIVNKYGGGSEEYIGMTKDGQKPIESEVIQGQQVDLDTPIMERFRKNYILESGVPAAMTNYLEEVDFAKSIETAHAEMNSNTCSYQIDCNAGHTELYRKLLKFSTNVPDEVVESITFTLQEPKGTSNIASQELVNNYQTLQDFLVKLFAGDNPSEEDAPRIRKFMFDLAQMHLTGINFAEIKKAWEESAIAGAEASIVSKDNMMDDTMEI